MCRDVPSHDVKYGELDVRVGGRYTIEVRTPEGIFYLGQGTFREVKPPEKLVFTWGWSETSKGKTKALQEAESLVTVELFERGKSTEMVVTHERFETVKERDETNTGWNGCFDVLAKLLKAQG
ncbi:MAG: SRPBCC domain-containing protein [Candidatus Acidiferrales bacterium]